MEWLGWNSQILVVNFGDQLLGISDPAMEISLSPSQLICPGLGSLLKRVPVHHFSPPFPLGISMTKYFGALTLYHQFSYIIFFYDRIRYWANISSGQLDLGVLMSSFMSCSSVSKSTKVQKLLTWLVLSMFVIHILPFYLFVILWRSFMDSKAKKTRRTRTILDRLGWVNYCKCLKE